MEPDVIRAEAARAVERPLEPVVVIRTGVANTASMGAALERCGARWRFAQRVADVRDAERVVLPGVGSFGAAMEGLRSAGFDEPLRARIAEGRPLLAICAGMQVLAAASEESPGVRGLGTWPAVVRRFPGGVRTPQLGWNRVEPGANWPESGGDAYFANSYRLVDELPGWACAMSDHGGPFVAAARRGPVLACQFHPELSGAWGERVLRRWLDGTTGMSKSGSTGEVAAC